MKLMKLIGVVLLCAFASAAQATKPCQPPDAQWFKTNVVDKSDVVVYAKIKDYSSFTEKSEKEWTNVQVVKLLHSAIMVPSNITVHGWQATLYPWYGHKKGDYVVLWLKGDTRAFTPTNLSWNQCVPSVWDAREDGEVYDLLQNNHWMSLEELGKMFESQSQQPH